jgi:N6-L-threonylcarbamoyladenine synthase
VVTTVRKHPEASTADVAASFRQAVVDVLVTRARRGAAEVGATALCLAGGVAANSLLRAG